MKESDMMTRSNLEFEELAAEAEAITAGVLESYDGNDVVELAALLDETLRKYGFAMKFRWLWSRASVALKD